MIDSNVLVPNRMLTLLEQLQAEAAPDSQTPQYVAALAVLICNSCGTGRQDWSMCTWCSQLAA